MEPFNRPLKQSSENKKTLWEQRFELTEDEVRKIAEDSSERELTDEEQEVLLCRLRWADDAKTELIITKPIAPNGDSKRPEVQMKSIEPAVADPNKRLIEELASRTIEAEARAEAAEKDAGETHMMIGVMFRVVLIAIALYVTRFLSERTMGFYMMFTTFGGIFWILKYVEGEGNRAGPRFPSTK